MKIYYLNTNPLPDGTRVVHAEKCEHLASFVSRDFLGHFYDPVNALREAKAKFRNVVTCQCCVIPIKKV